MSIGTPTIDDDWKVIHPIYEIGSELVAALEMDEMEGLVYLTLLRKGPTTASALSKEIGMERTKTYRIVEKLVNNGMVSMTFSTPKLCVTTNPEEAIKKVIHKKKEEIKRLTDVGSKVIHRLKGVVTADYGANLPTFRIVQGQEAIYSNIETAFDDLSGIIYMVTSINDISKMYYSHIPEKIKECEQKGCKVRLIIDKNDEKMQSYITRLNIKDVRHGKLPSNGRIIVSKTQMIMSDSSTLPNAKNLFDYALCTNSKEMINNILILCSFLWETSKPVTVLPSDSIITGSN